VPAIWALAQSIQLVVLFLPERMTFSHVVAGPVIDKFLSPLNSLPKSR
jgi:hypothetical protein